MIGADVDVAAEFGRLGRLEPRLDQLAGRCRAASGLPDSAKDLEWARSIKPHLLSLVGWHAAGHPDLRTEYAYDVAYRHLLDVIGL